MKKRVLKLRKKILISSNYKKLGVKFTIVDYKNTATIGVKVQIKL